MPAGVGRLRPTAGRPTRSAVPARELLATPAERALPVRLYENGESAREMRGTKGKRVSLLREAPVFAWAMQAPEALVCASGYSLDWRFCGKKPTESEII